MPVGRRPWPDDEPAVGGGYAAAERPAQILRRIEPWSALKVSLVLYLSLFIVALAVAVALWMAGRQSGLLGNLEELIEDIAGYQEDSFRFKDGDLLRLTAVVGPIFVVLASFVTVAGVTLYNLTARLFGGLEVTLTDSDDLRRRRRSA